MIQEGEQLPVLPDHRQFFLIAEHTTGQDVHLLVQHQLVHVLDGDLGGRIEPGEEQVHVLHAHVLHIQNEAQRIVQILHGLLREAVHEEQRHVQLHIQHDLDHAPGPVQIQVLVDQLLHPLGAGLDAQLDPDHTGLLHLLQELLGDTVHPGRAHPVDPQILLDHIVTDLGHQLLIDGEGIVSEKEAPDPELVPEVADIRHDPLRRLEPVGPAPEMAGTAEGTAVRTATAGIQRHEVILGTDPRLRTVVVLQIQPVIPVRQGVQIAQRLFRRVADHLPLHPAVKTGHILQSLAPIPEQRLEERHHRVLSLTGTHIVHIRDLLHGGLGGGRGLGTAEHRDDVGRPCLDLPGDPEHHMEMGPHRIAGDAFRLELQHPVRGLPDKALVVLLITPDLTEAQELHVETRRKELGPQKERPVDLLIERQRLGLIDEQNIRHDIAS